MRCGAAARLWPSPPARFTLPDSSSHAATFLPGAHRGLRDGGHRLGMSRPHLVLVAAGVAALAGGGTAVAANGHAHPPAPAVPLAVARPLTFRPLGLSTAATYLGTTVDALAT